jgi:hypothetical protein
MRKKDRLEEVLRDIQRRAENELSGQKLYLVEFGMNAAEVRIRQDRGTKNQVRYKDWIVAINDHGDFVSKPDPLMVLVAHTLRALWLYDQL